jgi:23S rRNA pseudouridine2605 synthase
VVRLLAPSGSRRRSGGRSDRASLRITLHEGRNRQVRKMCDAIGHPVDRLRRVAIGSLHDSRLKVGEWRELTDAEVARLRTDASDEAKVSRQRPAGKPRRDQ